LEDFFSLEEVDTAYFLAAPKTGQMMITNGTFSWEVDGEDGESSAVLRNVDLTIEPGELFAVVGRYVLVCGCWTVCDCDVCSRVVALFAGWEAASRHCAPRCLAS
jgi:hypothetical protein